ncbi:hypothetical protein [Photobacterium minamisatsumaniensis]|uniref:hypothetical protein n=1 Tax=Photobacterium minamisatsumaniensis TaxID=2910233 RepID=UPI003D12C30C
MHLGLPFTRERKINKSMDAILRYHGTSLIVIVETLSPQDSHYIESLMGKCGFADQMIGKNETAFLTMYVIWKYGNLGAAKALNVILKTWNNTPDDLKLRYRQAINS